MNEPQQVQQPQQPQQTLAPIKGKDALACMMACGATGALDVPKPFANPICLVPCTVVAGTSHIDNIEERIAGLAAGDRLQLVRDAGNSHDRWAIKVMNPQGQRIGFMSCDVNEVPARLMDGGKALYAQFKDATQRGTWLKINMGVFLDD